MKSTTIPLAASKAKVLGHKWLSGQKCKILDKPPVKHKTNKKENLELSYYSKVMEGI